MREFSVPPTCRLHRCRRSAVSMPRAPWAVLGIFSHGGNSHLRAWIRRSWLSPAAQCEDIIARFVLRGMRAPDTLRREARHGDIAFVSAESGLGRQQGPLASLFAWWALALENWAEAEFIGKADDDTFLHLRGISNFLHAAWAAVAESGCAQPRIYWGAFEQYHYDERRRRPAYYRQNVPSKCLRRPSSASFALHGPFPFAKGPVYFVSRALVDELLASRWVHADLDATLDSISPSRVRNRSRSLHHLPGVARTVWEDVYTGYLLSRVIGDNTGSKSCLAVVENGFGNGAANPIYSDGYGMQLANSTLIMHMR